MLSDSFWSRLINRAWDLQNYLEARGRRWIHKMGLGFIVGLFGFSLIAEGFIGIIYYQFCDKGIRYLINGDKYGNVPLYFNPVMIIIWGFMIVLILLLKKREQLTHK